MMYLKRLIFKIKFRIILKSYLNVMRRRKIVKNNIKSIKSEISDVNYNFEKYFTNLIFKNCPVNFNIFFRQYNIFRLIHSEKLNFKILKSKKIVYPLTYEQLNILEKNNFKVSYFFSNILLLIASIIEFFRGIIIFMYILLKSLTNLITFKRYNKKYIYIKNLNQDQILISKTQNIEFKNRIEKKFKIQNYELIHNNPKCKNDLIYNKFFLPEICSFMEIIKFIGFFLNYTLYIFLDLLFLRFKQLLIFSEIVKFCCAKSKNKKDLELSYFFFNTNAFFRPLYSYELGKNVFFFEYSLNNRNIYYDVKEKLNLFTIKNLTWNNYLIWNNDHKRTLEENQIIKANYYNFGTISFGPTKNFNLKTNSSNSILIFDSVPFRNSFFSIYNNYACSYFDNKIIEFLKDINKLDKNNTLYLKIKRDYNNKIYSKKYKKFVEQSNFILLDSKYDPEEVISKFEKIICLPFSSTAIIAEKLNKKVCFYDVCGINKNFDEIFKNIPIIRSFSELQKWCQS